MVFNFNVTGTDRKNLVKALEDILGERSHYMGMPTCSYEIHGMVISRNGELSCDDTSCTPELLTELHNRGFDPEDTETPEEAETIESTGNSDAPGPITDLVVSVARMENDEAAIERLQNMIASKRTLLLKSLGAEDLPLEITDTEIRFPWFKGPMTPDDGNAYIQLIGAMWKLAREQKRISAREKPTDNEKYAFRCWLLRLGFIGADTKATRKILMRNLTGSAAFRYGAPSADPEQGSEVI